MWETSARNYTHLHTYIQMLTWTHAAWGGGGGLIKDCIFKKLMKTAFTCNSLLPEKLMGISEGRVSVLNMAGAAHSYSLTLTPDFLNHISLKLCTFIPAVNVCHIYITCPTFWKTCSVGCSVYTVLTQKWDISSKHFLIATVYVQKSVQKLSRSSFMEI